ncbi:alpha/beta hydrolase [Priestia koreensis]|uniref:alpha/beta hydrolase n=1 Tax=Priestia koreensis TaxID=284581 RepID=UPI001F5955C4|nr:esterase family protein [Priestia koreensis]UNL85718.1 esterase family protein [Priestia koreensis]
MAQAQGKVEEITFFSESLQEDLTLMIYLPSTFSPLYKYTLLIAQDGRDYYTLGRTPRVLEELLSEENIEQTIFVGIPYKSVEDRRQKYHPEGAQRDQYVRFLAHELVPFLDERFPTLQMGKARALIGDSLGATVSLTAALTYPHTFGKVIMQSPYVDESVLEQVKQSEHVSLLDLYHIIGTEETAVSTTDGKVQDFLEPNRSLHTLMQEKNYSVFYEEFAGNHTWKYWQKDLKRALEMMLKN